MTLRKWTFTVDPEDAELRLDQLIAKRTELSRRSAREALMLGGVQVDRRRVKVAGKVVKPGIEVRVAFDPDLPPVPTTAIPVVSPRASPPRAPGPRTATTCWPC
jgi:23S rRNA pseudouridine1911/1915/1917 synthase